MCRRSWAVPLLAGMGHSCLTASAAATAGEALLEALGLLSPTSRLAVLHRCCAEARPGVPQTLGPPLTLFPKPTSAARVNVCPWSELRRGGGKVAAVIPVGGVDWYIVPVVWERPSGEARLPLNLPRHRRLPP
eukprot:1165605-Pyramimonas_sp.AAC.1